MKIPGKLPLATIVGNLVNLSDLNVATLNSSVSASPQSIVSININKTLTTTTNKTFSIELINYVQPYEIDIYIYTLFYTLVDHNLAVGDRVFVIGGNYDSDLLIQQNLYAQGTDGYIVQYVDRTIVVLDIVYTGQLPYNDVPIDDFVKVYVASSQDEFEYFCQCTSNRGDITSNTNIIPQLEANNPILTNKFAYSGTYSTNNFLFINGTFSISSEEYGILGFSYSGTQSSLTYSNSFLVFNSGYLVDITQNVLSGSFSEYISMDLPNNGNIAIINESFQISGINFIQDYIYSFTASAWQVNRTYLPAIITQQNFRNGVLASGNYNQGLFGTNLEQIIYDGTNVTFNMGTILNTNWIAGQMGYVLSGLSASYFTTFISGSPSIKSNQIENGGFGYNYVYDTIFSGGSIVNGNIYNSVIGSQSTNLVVLNDTLSQSTTFSVSTTGGSYNSCDIYYSEISNSTINNCYSNNSEINLSNSINSQFERTLFYNSTYTAKSTIQIQDYEESCAYYYDGVNQNVFKTYKFYLNEDDFELLSQFESFYFQGLNINITSTQILNFFDDKFSVDAYYYTSDSLVSPKPTQKIIVQLSSIEENRYENDISYDGVTYLETNPNYGLPSLDIAIEMGEDFNSTIATNGTSNLWYFYNFNPTYSSFFITINVVNESGYISATNSNDLVYTLNTGNQGNPILGTWTYSQSTSILSVIGTYSFVSIVVDSVNYYASNSPFDYSLFLSSNTVDVSSAYIVNADFKSGVFENSQWVSGNYINYNGDNSIFTNTNGYYFNVNSPSIFNSSLPQIELPILSQYRQLLFDINDVVFVNGLYYNTSLILGTGSNLVELSDTYTIANYTPYSGIRNVTLTDIYGTNSVLFNVPAFVNSPYLITINAENNYNYLHPVKFINSIISEGIFQRAYFVGCSFSNPLFNNLEKDFVTYTNARSMLISDVIFNNNGNSINSGVLQNSSFLAGSDNWNNGIVYNSIWSTLGFTYSNSATGSVIYNANTQTFNNGIFKFSRWNYGIFGNGLFYNNESNLVGTSSVFSDSIGAYYRYNDITRYSWLDGLFLNGNFELNNWEYGTFSNGNFYNSSFINGVSYGGNFGLVSVPYYNTQILSGSFSGLNVINAEFTAQDPLGGFATTSIIWNSGVFNGGIFGVDVNESFYYEIGLNYPFNSIWNSGTFNGGNFQDISQWINGTFNNGNFTSYYGYPFVTAASYSYIGSPYFAWQSGSFNGGQFGNGGMTANSTWYTGDFNGGSFMGRYWFSGVLTNGNFFGSATYSTTLANVPSFISGFSEQFYGLWNDGFVTEVKDRFITNQKFYTTLQRSVDYFRETNTVNVNNVLWLNGTFSHSDGALNNSIWLNGTFQNGDFNYSSFNPYVNYILNGNFANYFTNWNFTQSEIINGSFIISSNQDLSYINATSSIGYAYQDLGLEIGNIYTATIIVANQYNTELRAGSSIMPCPNGDLSSTASWTFIPFPAGPSSSVNLTIATGYPGSLNYLDIDETGSGTCSSGACVIPGILTVGAEYYMEVTVFNIIGLDAQAAIEVGSSDLSIGSYSYNTQYPFGATNFYNGAVYNTTFTAQYSDFTIYCSSVLSPASECGFQLANVILTSNTHGNGPFGVISSTDTSTQSTYTFTFSATTPYFSLEFIPEYIGNTYSGPIWLETATCSISSVELIEGISGFNIEDTCVWEGGNFVESEFYISQWQNGNFISGTAYGMIWLDGIANYMNAYNVYWADGTWENGNWYGSPFTYTNIISTQSSGLTYSTVASGFANDILTNISLYRESINDTQYQDIFINDAFNELIINPEILSNTNLTNGIDFISATNSGFTIWTPFVADFGYTNYQFIGSQYLNPGEVSNYLARTPIFGEANFNPSTELKKISYKLYAMVDNIGNDQDIFTYSNQYDITIKYIVTALTQSNVSNLSLVFNVNVGYQSNLNNGGFSNEIIETVNMYPIKGTSPTTYWGQSPKVKILTYTFNPTSIGSPGMDGTKLYIQKLLSGGIPITNTDPSTTLYILNIEVVQKELDYDPIYNNATYSIFGITPSFGNELILPPTNYLGGSSDTGIEISSRFGNGIFEAGIWENGVWNEGLRYDQNVIYFDDLNFFTNGLNSNNQPIQLKPIASQGDNVSFPSSAWRFSLSLTNNQNITLTQSFSVGDQVSVGNICMIDTNGNSQLIVDPLTVVVITATTLTLEFQVGFPIRTIQKDSDQHLIYVTNNIWLNGAFLNGLFKGVWNGGLFKGFPYITQMIDTHWITGVFSGGQFQGFTFSVINSNGSYTTYDTALIQNFQFSDQDQSIIPYEHNYNSWINVNYESDSYVTIGKNTIAFDSGKLFGPSFSVGEYTQTNFFRPYTKDVLSSISTLRDNYDANFNIYSLGYNYTNYTNYLATVGLFSNYYDTSTTLGTNNFLGDEFTYSSIGYAKSNKAPETGFLYYQSNNGFITSSNVLEFNMSGTTDSDIYSNAIYELNNTLTSQFETGRYNYISFDIVSTTWSVGTEETNGSAIISATSGGNYLVQLQLTLDSGEINDINSVYATNLFNREIYNIQEYFYNKIDLNLFTTVLSSYLLSGTSSALGFYIENLQFVETDMIPFIQLGTESSVNQSIQAPYQSTAPSLNNQNSNFSLINNLNISESIFVTIQSGFALTSGGFQITLPSNLDLTSLNNTNFNNNFVASYKRIVS